MDSFSFYFQSFVRTTIDHRSGERGIVVLVLVPPEENMYDNRSQQAAHDQMDQRSTVLNPWPCRFNLWIVRPSHHPRDDTAAEKLIRRRPRVCIFSSVTMYHTTPTLRYIILRKQERVSSFSTEFWAVVATCRWVFCCRLLVLSWELTRNNGERRLNAKPGPER